MIYDGDEVEQELCVDLYWSFRSPYSYLALHHVRALAKAYALRWNVKVVYPLAIRTPDFFKRMDHMWRPYLLIDTQRIAESLGMPFRRPVPDPIVQDPRTLLISLEQPHIHRLTRLGAEAMLRGRALELVDAVGTMLWDGSVDGWNQGDHLARAVAAAGLDLQDMETAIARDPQARDRLIETNEAELRAAGHWGVPTFVFRGEPFFGQDRVELLLWRLRQHGLQARSN
ncbi:2-hydroxychromene-2-carboxylate isomerase [Candidimonas nitroreducens]|uniref:2-hydroxychromene-2-carboxylate isomerase n=1 Tax=Candidimonas nitroreducens TaxID=683354 RepID=A0A225MUJ5_9BURK|nr:DsbA family protein [Candidimonas nitroreducens]OWT63520.1 disulfide bond formation protein DsbA [Candidimonas nitroreducens]